MPSQRWKDLEREAARALGGKRVVRPDFGEPDVDVTVPAWPELRVDCKAYKRFAHHSLMQDIERKYCDRPGQVPVLVTKHERQRGAYVTVPLDWLGQVLARMWELQHKNTEWDTNVPF